MGSQSSRRRHLGRHPGGRKPDVRDRILESRQDDAQQLCLYLFRVQHTTQRDECPKPRDSVSEGRLLHLFQNTGHQIVRHPLLPEHRSQGFNLIQRCFSHRPHRVPKGLQEDPLERRLESFGTEMPSKPGDLFDHSQTNAPLLVCCQCLHRRQNGMRDLVTSHYLTDLPRMTDHVQSDVMEVVLHQVLNQRKEKPHRRLPTNLSRNRSHHVRQSRSDRLCRV
mmetsp:Transcript_22543/g.44626  ORF Transcript_22543/g.44626 Transcript_22543/m.44626 type:complete len:222 (-) Transcript_22543:1334-1999(-)